MTVSKELCLYQIYIPSQMSLEIYSKLYLALFRSMQKKGTQMAIKQRYENYKAIQQQSYKGILGGSDSFTIIGTSGIEKSSVISRAISLITENRIIETDKPYTKIIPCLRVQCTFDSSVKGLLEILRKVDEEFGTDHYIHAVKSRAWRSLQSFNPHFLQKGICVFMKMWYKRCYGEYATEAKCEAFWRSVLNSYDDIKKKRVRKQGVRYDTSSDCGGRISICETAYAVSAPV